MKISVIPKLTQEQRELLESSTYLPGGLLPKAIGVPSPFSLLKPPFSLSREVFELIIIPFDSIDMGKRGLLMYGKKYKPTFVFDNAQVFFESGQVFSSSNGEHGVGSFESNVDFTRSPKTFLIHIGICNHKFVIVMAHKDHTNAPNVFGAPLAFNVFETPDNDFPYPINADWHGLPGSWEYHQAERSGKPVVTPNLINSMMCEIIVSECGDYVPIAYTHDYFTKSRDIVTAPNSFMGTIANSVSYHFNIHDTISEFLVKCRSNNVLESGYIASQISAIPSFSKTSSAEEPAYATYSVYEPPNKFMFGEVAASSSSKSIRETGYSSEKNVSKSKKSSESKSTAVLKLQQEIASLKGMLVRRDEEIKYMRGVADKYKKENDSILNSDGISAEKACEAAAEKHNANYNFGTNLLSEGIAGLGFIFDFITNDYHQLDDSKKSRMPDLSDNVFISLLVNKDVGRIEVKSFNNSVFLIEVEKKETPNSSNEERHHFRLYQLINMNNLTNWFLEATDVIRDFYNDPIDKNAVTEKVSEARRFLGYLNALMKHENECLKSATSTNKIFMLEEDD